MKMGTGMAKYLAILAVLFFAVPTQAAGLDASFDMKALSGDYAQSCAVRTDIRRANIQPAFDSYAPAAFVVKDVEFLKISPKLSQEQKNLGNEVFRKLPPHIKDFAYIYGLVYTMPRVIAEAVPMLHDDENYYNDLGLYINQERHAYIPFTRANTSRSSNGKLIVGRYMPSTRDRDRMITHESGHAIDDILGRMSLDRNDDQRITLRADYLAAFDADMARLAAIPGVTRNDNIQHRGYYLPESYKGTLIGGAHQDERRARREVFAELWAEINNHSPHELSKIYPNTFAFVKQVNSVLYDLHQKAVVQCRYTADGKAVSP